MAVAYKQDKTEAPTPKRREYARREGQVARSREVTSAILFLGVTLFFTFGGSALSRQLLGLTRETLGNLDRGELSVQGLYLLLTHFLYLTAFMLLPVLLTVFGLAFGAGALQTGFLFSLKSLQPRLSRLNPWQHMQRLFSLQSIHDLFKSTIKVGVVGSICYMTIANELEQFIPLSSQSVGNLTDYLGRSILRLCARASYAIIALALLDYLFQRWQHEKNIRMSRQEVKDEKKQEEGDPQIKTRVRSIMREIARRRMMEDVPKADVIVTNPTHIAVALQYRRDEMPAPKVLAKGAGYVAERIKIIAREHRIPLVENKAVAQALYKSADIGAFIPETLYRAVAEILAYVYRLRPPAAS